ncbi:hypothetical protein [Bosea sp. 2RAB26]|uniref:hypothetical protein n=1 Tax=Bosea sp. 2RAB26 TaxID=3237476 RepID=UPI003F90D671
MDTTAIQRALVALGYAATLEYEFTPGSTSAQTITIRVGANSGNIAFNRQPAQRLLGGLSARRL